MPKIVQNILNSQKLPVHSGEIRALSSKQLNISLNTQLDTPLPAKLDALPLEISRLKLLRTLWADYNVISELPPLELSPRFTSFGFWSAASYACSY